MKNLYLAHWKKDIIVNKFNGEALSYKAGSVSFITFAANNLAAMIEKGTVVVYELESVIPSWTIHQKQPRIMNVFFGNYGLGDHFAFSAMVAWCNDNDIHLKVHLNKTEMVAYDYFRHRNYTLVPDTLPISKMFKLEDLLRLKKQRRLRMEWAAVEAKQLNWYDAMFKRIGFDEAPAGYKNPKLRSLNHSYIPESVYINHRASTQVRSSHFKDFYLPVKAVFPTHMIFVSRYDLTTEDQQWIDSNNVDVNILEPGSTAEYLKYLESFAIVVCTDSAAIHFREGISMPALAVYGAFSKSSRTAYYRNTISIDIASNCDLQHCYDHSPTCQRAQDNIAPCQSGDMFQAQLTEALKAYK